jgi:hypothetical protein
MIRPVSMLKATGGFRRSGVGRPVLIAPLYASSNDAHIVGAVGSA